MLALLEHYTSVQGEGPRVGELTQFIRFGGCNMRCPGWPCDTQHAIQPELWRPNIERITVSDLEKRIVNEHERTGASNICLTGGEPFIQSDDDLRELSYLLTADCLDIEVFTNGSFDLDRLWIRQNELHFTMDWKLSGSGEANTKRDARWKNALKNLTEADCIKFVCKDGMDLNEASALTLQLIEEGCEAEFYVGRVWDEFLTDEMIVEYIKSNRMPWKLNVQIHKLIWPADMKGV